MVGAFDVVFGEPGKNISNFWIRGISTFGASSGALVLIDGIEGRLEDIDPDDVKSFSILKDASATAVYGTRGANGVVLVTTKRGETGKLTITGRTPGKVQAIRPMKDGVIADFETTEIMLNSFIKKVNGRGMLSKPRILICCPSNITQVEKNAIKEAAERTGARKVFLEEEPKVAAVGAGMDISKPSGNMVIDIGGGTTDIAILSLGGIVYQ